MIWTALPGANPLRLAALFLIVCSAAFAWAQADLLSRNGLWIDEYFSIWASDPGLPLAGLLASRILPDTNPPLYFTALALTRLMIEHPRTAFLALNILAIVVVAAFVWATGRRAAMPAAALCAIGLFIISGPALCFAPEGRAYLFGLCTAFAIAWAAALVLSERDRPPLYSFAVLGVLAALSHVFAALFAGAFGAALLAEGLLRRRVDLARAGLVLGLGAVVAFGVWLLFVIGNLGNVDWIEFSFGAVRDAIWYVSELAFGHTLIGLILIGFLVWSWRQAAMRPLLRVFAFAMALFVILPILVSLVTPLVVGRYWLIGAPALIVLALFALRAELQAPPQPRAAVSAGVGAAALLAASLLGFFNAQTFTAGKPVWHGVALAAPLLEQCAPGSVRITGSWLFATASGAPEAVFENAAAPGVEVRSLDAGACPVIGWAEHVREGEDFLATAPDAALLGLLKLEGEGARIVRHASGFVVLRPEAPDRVNQ